MVVIGCTGSPRQAMVVPVVTQFDDYAYEVKQKLWDIGVMVEIETDPNDTLNKKIRNAQLAQFNFVLVVGEKERNAGIVNIRTRDNGEMAVNELIAKLKVLEEPRDQSGK